MTDRSFQSLTVGEFVALICRGAPPVRGRRALWLSPVLNVPRSAALKQKHEAKAYTRELAERRAKQRAYWHSGNRAAAQRKNRAARKSYERKVMRFDQRKRLNERIRDAKRTARDRADKATDHEPSFIRKQRQAVRRWERLSYKRRRQLVRSVQRFEDAARSSVDFDSLYGGLKGALAAVEKFERAAKAIGSKRK